MLLVEADETHFKGGDKVVGFKVAFLKVHTVECRETSFRKKTT